MKTYKKEQEWYFDNIETEQHLSILDTIDEMKMDISIENGFYYKILFQEGNKQFTYLVIYPKEIIDEPNELKFHRLEHLNHDMPHPIFPFTMIDDVKAIFKGSILQLYLMMDDYAPYIVEKKSIKYDI